MTDRIGGSIEGMRRLKSTFNSEASNLQSIIDKISPAVNDVQWEGAAAQKFKEAWNTEFKSKLTTLVGLLNDSGSEVQSRIDALIAAGG